MKFTYDNGTLDADIQALFIAGWTGRNAAAVAHHIAELAEIGVAPPSTTPLFYRGSASLLVQAETIGVLGPDTSGEAEPLLLRHNGSLWLGLGSDHTDRRMEAVSVAASKQACPKPCAPVLWRFDDVAGHLDALRLTSWIREDAEWVSYQDGALDMILPLERLLDLTPLSNNQAMLCGTLPAIAGVRPARHFRAELTDPILNRSIQFDYSVDVLAIIL